MIRVDLSLDDGAHWMQAVLQPKPETPHGRDYSWTLWEARIPVPEPMRQKSDTEDSIVEVVARATDDAYNVQPEKVEHLWNMRGVLNNAWSRKEVDLRN